MNDSALKWRQSRCYLGFHPFWALPLLGRGRLALGSRQKPVMLGCNHLGWVAPLSHGCMSGKESCLGVEAGVHHCRWELEGQTRTGSFVPKGLGENPGSQYLYWAAGSLERTTSVLIPPKMWCADLPSVSLVL